MTLLDANYILRYLLNDHPEMFEEAKRLIEKEACMILGEVLAEVVYVLEGYYKTPRPKVAAALRLFLKEGNVHMHEPLSVVMNALRLYAESSLDYVDCYLCALKERYRVATFDKKLRRCLAY